MSKEEKLFYLVSAVFMVGFAYSAISSVFFRKKNLLASAAIAVIVAAVVTYLSSFLMNPLAGALESRKGLPFYFFYPGMKKLSKVMRTEYLDWGRMFMSFAFWSGFFIIIEIFKKHR